MLVDLAREHGVELGESYLIGDSWKDTLAASAAGCRSIILDRPYNQGDPATAVSQIWRGGGINFGRGGKMKAELDGYIQSYLHEAEAICTKLSQTEIGRMVEGLVRLRAEGGRLFILGVGGSAANASHAVNDFRKIANIESYTPTDNVSELTARINDEGWDRSYSRWLSVSRLRQRRCGPDTFGRRWRR